MMQENSGWRASGCKSGCGNQGHGGPQLRELPCEMHTQAANPMCWASCPFYTSWSCCVQDWRSHGKALDPGPPWYRYTVCLSQAHLLGGSSPYAHGLCKDNPSSCPHLVKGQRIFGAWRTWFYLIFPNIPRKSKPSLVPRFLHQELSS
jgi:hypothetical protein